MDECVSLPLGPLLDKRDLFGLLLPLLDPTDLSMLARQGAMDSGRHVIGCQFVRATRVQNACDVP